MELGITGKLPSVFSKDDLNFIRNYLYKYGDSSRINENRKHLSNFHSSWQPLENFLSKKLSPILGLDYNFCFALANTFYNEDSLIHTDICLRHTTLPQGFTLPLDEKPRMYYSLMLVEDYERKFGNHKPSTYIFEKSFQKITNDAPDYMTVDDIDLSWPTYEVSDKTRLDLKQIPFEIVERLKVLDVIEQSPLDINYWQSYQYHVSNSFFSQGVAWKKFINVMVSKEI